MLLRFCARGVGKSRASAAAARLSYECLSAAFSAGDMLALQHVVEEEQARAGAAGGLSAIETWLQLLLQLLRKTPRARAAASSYLHAHPVIHQEMRANLIARTCRGDTAAGAGVERSEQGSERKSRGRSGAAGSQSRFASAMASALSDRDMPLHSVLKDPMVTHGPGG